MKNVSESFEKFYQTEITLAISNKETTSRNVTNKNLAKDSKISFLTSPLSRAIVKMYLNNFFGVFVI